MKTITWILFGIIIIVGAIAIVITKLYYRKKEKKEKRSFEDELGMNYYAPRTRENIEGKSFRRKPQQNPEVQRQRREIAAFSKSMPSQGNDDFIFDDYYNEPINSRRVNNERKVDSTRNIPKSNVNNPVNPNTPKTKEMEMIIGANTNQVASKVSQEPMTNAHKEFIKDQQKRRLIIEEGSGIKIINTTPNTEAEEPKVKEITNINEITTEKTEEKTEEEISSINSDKPKKNKIKNMPKKGKSKKKKSKKINVSKEEITPKENIIPKEEPKEETKIENITSKEEPKVEEIIKPKEETSTKEEPKEETKIENITSKEDITTEEVNLEDTLNQIIEESHIESSNLIDEIMKEIKSESNEIELETPKIENIQDIPPINKETLGTSEETKIEETPKIEETVSQAQDEIKPRIRKLPEFNKDELEIGETTLEDHEPISEFNIDNLTKEEDEDEDFISPILKNSMKGAVDSLKTLRSNLFNEERHTVEEVVEETYEEEYDYEEDDFYAITPLSEEEIKTELGEETATITPINEDNIKEVTIPEEVYEETKEIKIDEEDLVEETIVEEDTKEDPKLKAKDELNKLREENTKKLANISGDQNIFSKAKLPRETIKPHIPTEQVAINGEVYELKKGQNIMFVYNNETYSSTILAVKPGYVGVRYRSKNVWVKNSRIKKVFKY